MGRFTISSEDGEEPAERGDDGAIVSRVIEPVTASNVLWANTVRCFLFLLLETVNADETL